MTAAPPKTLPRAKNPRLREATTSVSTFCRICEAGCGLIAELDGDRLVRLRPNAEHAHSRGFCCNKPQGLLELTYDPQRLTVPMLRSGGPGEFTPISWDDALDICATRLRDVRDRHGAIAIANLRGNPAFFESAGSLWGGGFAAALGITRTYTVNAEDAASRLAANEALYGDVLRFPRPDLWRTDLALVVGANPLVARSTRLSEPQSREALDSIVARGGRVIVVDPRRTKTAERYEHVSIRPGTDPWFLLGVCAVICASPDLRQRSGRGAAVSQLDEFAALVARISLPECASRCGVPVETIQDVGDAFLRAGAATTYGGTGACAQRFGTLANILQDSVLALTGNIDRVGGVLAGWAAIDLSPATPGPPIGTRRSRVEKRPEIAGSLPSAGLAADITHPGEDRIRAVIMRANNSVLSSGGGGRRLEDALEQLDFSMAMDLYVNETNRYAHVLLPATTMFERDDYPLNTANAQLRPTAYATRAVIEPQGEARDAWSVFDDISRRMGLGGSCPDKELEAEAEARGARPTPHELIDKLFGAGAHPDLRFDDLVTNHPNGLTLRDTLPEGRLTAGLPTPDGRVRLFSSHLQTEIDRLFAYVEPDDEWPMRMVGRREPGSQNTWMHQATLIYPDSYRFAAHLHPTDAERHGVVEGETVLVVSPSGSISVPIAFDDAMRPGVVSIPNGWGHPDDGSHRGSFAENRNSNDLVSHEDVEQLAGMSILNGVPIRIERLLVDATPHRNADHD
ncbi:molybdopterin-containing oxidoreductase family protein [Microbacterium trichothecenolyticum]|uniref:Polysulfide reductase chain A n=1 Tax=Microbacterium trichothecenolyticum TaxID=69370 RepID=A0A0M2HDP5_MICTR|nr:molybdopterin-dependent oxidoreductase [Microbacterium trichothecenolyticum]KJL42307.1 Polysulfide reductase chain A precursor [Microbacterium trichothecenolyticum]